MSVRRLVVNGEVRWQARVARAGRRLSALCVTREEARLTEAELYERLTSTEVRSVESLTGWLGEPTIALGADMVQRFRRPLVYAWIRGSDVLYVGKSEEGIARPLSGQHHRLGDLPAGARLVCWSVDSPEAAARLEAEVIHRCCPRLNVQRNNGGNGLGQRDRKSAPLNVRG